jgi:hypothetical protein
MGLCFQFFKWVVSDIDLPPYILRFSLSKIDMWVYNPIYFLQLNDRLCFQFVLTDKICFQMKVYPVLLASVQRA